LTKTAKYDIAKQNVCNILIFVNSFRRIDFSNGIRIMPVRHGRRKGPFLKRRFFLKIFHSPSRQGNKPELEAIFFISNVFNGLRERNNKST